MSSTKNNADRREWKKHCFRETEDAKIWTDKTFWEFILPASNGSPNIVRLGEDAILGR